MLKEILEQNRANPWEINGTILDCKFPLIMGIVNVTPDSFYDGGLYYSKDAAFEHAVDLLQQGAHILDIGGESSRPGATPVSEQEELDRVCPLVERLVQLQKQPNDINHLKNRDFFISIDTTKSKVAEECIKLGAHIINDISACTMDSKMPQLIAQTNVSVVLNHMRGNFSTMQKDYTPYKNVVDEVLNELLVQANYLIKLGVQKGKICLDPGIGFGKSVKDNIELIKSVEKFLDTGFPILIGASRKSYIGKISNLENSNRLIPTITSGIIVALGGASCIRVHDVKETYESLLYLEALKASGTI